MAHYILGFILFQTTQAVSEFGATVESLLIKHGKKIIGNYILFVVSMRRNNVVFYSKESNQKLED